MKKYLALACIALGIVISGCERERSLSLTFDNDFEAMGNYAINFYSIARGNAHSGKFYSKTDTVNRFSCTYIDTIGGISRTPLKSVHVSAWVNFLSTSGADGDLVFGIVNKDGKELFSKITNIKNSITTPDEWSEIVIDADIPANITNGDWVKAFVVNNSRAEIKVDDFSVQFE